MIDLRSTDFLTDPVPALARLRADGPVARMRLPLIGPVWMTTTDAAARALLKDDARFVRDSRGATGKSLAQSFWWMPRRIAPLLQTMILKDGDDHARLRRLVSAAFARTAMDDLRPAIAARAEVLLDRIDPARPIDLVPHYTRPLPFEVICELLGLSEAARPALRRGLAPLSGATGAPQMLIALLRMGGVMRLIRAQLADVRLHPRAGLMSDLVAARDGGDRLSEEELLAMVMMLFVAGHETTVHLINDCLLTLMHRPELRASLADPSRMATFVEEAMRFWSPVMMTKLHFVRETCDFQGVRLTKGDRITAFLLAANHDPDRIEAPEHFDPTRLPNPHLGFGFGPHVCLGLQLARAEVAEALRVLLTRYPDVVLDGPPPRWLRRVGLRGPEALRVRLRP